MIVSHRIRLAPNNKQRTLLAQHAGYARYAWNWGVAESRRALDAGEKRATSQYRLRPVFNAVKRDMAPWSERLSQNPAKNALMALGDAWRRCFNTKLDARRPVFHSRDGKASYRADNGPGTVKTEGQTIVLPKVGAVRARELPRFDGEVRSCVVKRTGGHWFASLSYEIADPPPKVDGDVIGVDVGLRKLATIHDGERAASFENPKPLQKALRSLRRCDKAIARSRKVHGRNRRSERRKRKLLRRERIYARMRSVRDDAAKKMAASVAGRARVVVVEDLHVSGWARNRRLARSAADASTGSVLTCLRNACARRGVRVVTVDRFFPSSKLCSACGVENSWLGFEEEWCCRSCGVIHDRDENAALNLFRQGLPDQGRGGSAPWRTDEASISQTASSCGRPS